MKQTNWYKDAIVYQIYPLSFCDSNGDGIGDIKGIISKLDHLVRLGVNTVWLSPIYASPMEDNGYDVSDYYSINPLFGTMEDFELMVEEMHKRGIKLVMDMVMNHTSSEHEWFKKSIDKNSPYHDYYFWKKGKGKKAPNNWTGFFAEKAWEYNKDNDMFYLHLFAKGQPDLNWDNPLVREEFKKIIKFWCDKGVDGYRFDVINLISKDNKFKNGHSLVLKGQKEYINGPHLHQYLQEINKDALSLYDTFTVGEIVFSSVDDILKLTSVDRKELNMVFNFEHTSADNFFGVKWFLRKFKLKRFKKPLSKYQKALFENSWSPLFFENHDQRRSPGRFNTDDKEYRVISSKMLATSIYFLRGTPFIYEGQEIGMTNTDIKDFNDYVDVESHNTYKTMKKLHLPMSYIKKSLANGTRDNARVPMQWDNSEYAGFSTSKPWLKINDNKSFINVKASYEDKDSIFNYYKNLLQVRKNEKLVKEGRYEDIDFKNKKVYAYKRIGEKEELIVIANYSKDKVKFKIKDLKEYEIIINNYDSYENSYLLPYQAVVLKVKR